MAEKVTVELLDDLDGTVASGTVRFGLDGKDYEIDLSEHNADQLREVLRAYVLAARKVGGSPRRATGPRPLNDTAAIRAWARENGYKVNDRGRINADVIKAYTDRDRPASPESPGQVAPVPEQGADATDEEIAAWWSSKGYKPQTKVNGLMRAQFRKATG